VLVARGGGVGSPLRTRSGPITLMVPTPVRLVCPLLALLTKNLDLGFIASSSQLVGTTVFWIAGFTALPGVLNVLSPAALYGAYWFPLILGGVFFVVSGFLFMIETQKYWWLPAPKTLGWHVGEEVVVPCLIAKASLTAVQQDCGTLSEASISGSANAVASLACLLAY